MGRVVRVVRLPELPETMAFELSLPSGAEILKAGGVFAGVVDAQGNPVPSAALFLLVDPDQSETEVRRFQAAELTSGLDDLTSEAPALPGSLYRYIADIRDGVMLFELLDASAEIQAPASDVPIIHI